MKPKNWNRLSKKDKNIKVEDVSPPKAKAMGIRNIDIL